MEPNYVEIFQYTSGTGRFGWSIGSDAPGSGAEGAAATFDEAVAAALAAVAKMRGETT
jgi:hypothetical protein